MGKDSLPIFAKSASGVHGSGDAGGNNQPIIEIYYIQR
jgi:hypothetical protein